MQELQYLRGYPGHLTDQVQCLITEKKLQKLLLKKYPTPHEIRTDKALYEYVIAIKNQ